MPEPGLTAWRAWWRVALRASDSVSGWLAGWLAWTSRKENEKKWVASRLTTRGAKLGEDEVDPRTDSGAEPREGRKGDEERGRQAGAVVVL